MVVIGGGDDVKSALRTWWLPLLATCSALAAKPDGGSSAEALVGLWGFEQLIGPLVAGELTVDARGSEWRARIAGYDVGLKRQGERLEFALPASAGELRARLTADGKAIIGQWIQPANAVYNNRYASPVVLAKVTPKAWRGQVVPLAERISFYVSIQRAADGSLTASIRNPEFNWFRRRTYSVKLENGAVVFTQDQQQIRGSYDEQSGVLTLPLLGGSPPIQLTKRTEEEAIGFYPRVPPSPYVYQPPLSAEDGWPIASLHEVGLDAKPIAELMEKILGANLDEDPIPMHSLLIARHGKLVFEEYFRGYSRERPHDMRSAGKTWATVLVGAARQRGAKIGPPTAVYSLFARYKPFAHWDERKGKLTLRDLMTMTSGLACDDNDSNSPGEENRMQSQTEQPDWYKYTLDLPMAGEPGGNRAIYCSADTNLVGGAVREATGRWLPEIFYEWIAQPLNIRHYHLNLTPTGEAYMGGGAYFRPRDLLKLGQLYLNGGVWNGHRVVSKEWVEQSTRRYSDMPDPMTKEHQYGFAWHIYHYDVGGRRYTAYFAAGNGGQLVLVFPELDMVVNYNGGAYGEGRKFYPWQVELVPRYIVPAAAGQPKTAL